MLNSAEALQVAYDHHRAGRLAEAEAAYHQALRLDPTSALTHNNLGTLFRGQQKLDEAIACFREAIRLDPLMSDAHFNLAAALAARGAIDEAIAAFDQTIALRPDFAEAYLHRGRWREARYRYREAAEDLETAIRHRPALVEGYNELAVLFNDMGLPDVAVEYCRRGLEQAPNSPALFSNLAIGLKLQGRMPRRSRWPARR